MSHHGDSPPPIQPPIPAVPPRASFYRRRGARRSIPPIHDPEDYFPPQVDQAMIDWAHELQAQGFAPEPPDQPYDLGIAAEELDYDPDQIYDPFRGWQQELPAVDGEQDEPEQMIPEDDDGYEEDDEADDEDEDEDPEEDPDEDDFWVADPAPEDQEEDPVEDVDADMGPFPGAPDAPFHPFPGPPAAPDFPSDTDLGEVIDPTPEEVLTMDAVRAQRDALMAQQGTDWVRIHELEGHLVQAQQQRDEVTQQWTEERARAGRAQQVAAISGQAVRRMTMRLEEDVGIFAREFELSDQEFQAHVQQMVRIRAERRHRAQQKAHVRHDWGEGTSRQGGQG